MNWVKICFKGYRRAAVLTVLALIAVGAAREPATAETNWTADELAVLQSGAPVVGVTPAPKPADGEVRAAIDVPAPKSAVWAVLVDCEGAPAFMDNLKSCSVLEKGGDWDVREHQIQWTTFLPKFKSVFRSQYVKEQSIVFKRTSGDLQYLEGSWRLEPRAGGAVTRIHYEVRVGFSSLVPGFLVRDAMARDIPHFLTVLRNEALQRARS